MTTAPAPSMQPLDKPGLVKVLSTGKAPAHEDAGVHHADRLIAS